MDSSNSKRYYFGSSTNEVMSIESIPDDRICVRQELSLEQVRDEMTNSVLTPSMPERFELTEEQLVCIAMEEGISMKDGIYFHQ